MLIILYSTMVLWTQSLCVHSKWVCVVVPYDYGIWLYCPSNHKHALIYKTTSRFLGRTLRPPPYKDHFFMVTTSRSHLWVTSLLYQKPNDPLIHTLTNSRQSPVLAGQYTSWQPLWNSRTSSPCWCCCAGAVELRQGSPGKQGKWVWPGRSGRGQRGVGGVREREKETTYV